MSSESHQPPSRPTLEDLLRFKRAERPPPEFWAEFDRGLRQKQLAALMKRPQGWARVRPILIGGLRWAVPATAAAAVALVILQLPHDPSSKQDASVAAVAPQPIPVSEQPALSPIVQVAAAVPETRFASSAQAEAPVIVAQNESTPAPEQAQVQVASTGVVERTLPWSAASLASSNLPAYRAESLYPVRLTSREAPRRSNSSWTSRFSEMVRDLSAEQADARVLQLASMDLPGAGQFGASAAPIGTNQMVASNDRGSRSLSERQMRDLDSRFGVKATSVSIKF